MRNCPYNFCFIGTGWVIITESGIDTIVFYHSFIHFFFQPMSIFFFLNHTNYVVTQLVVEPVIEIFFSFSFLTLFFALNFN